MEQNSRIKSTNFESHETSTMNGVSSNISGPSQKHKKFWLFEWTKKLKDRGVKSSKSLDGSLYGRCKCLNCTEWLFQNTSRHPSNRTSGQSRT